MNAKSNPPTPKPDPKPVSQPGETQGKLKRIVRRLALFPLLAIAGLYFLSMTAEQPDNLGESHGQLAKCPDSQNCVSSQSSDPRHAMPPIALVGSNSEIMEKIKAVVAGDFSRARLISETDNYLHFEFTSAIFRFVDDVEFLVDDEANVVHFRSASRVGHSDLGANRKRMEKISERLSL